MMSLRFKLFAAFAAMFLVTLVLGVQSLRHIDRLGMSIDVILRENYRSVVACQEMKESLERIDSGVLFVLLENDVPGKQLIAENREKFETNLATQQSNITLPDEDKRTAQLTALYEEYRDALDSLIQSTAADRQSRYFTDLLPLFTRIKEEAQTILSINQQNMVLSNARARQQADSTSQDMLVYLVVALILLLICQFLTGRWILKPLANLRSSAMAIGEGNLDLTVAATSHDEIGDLSHAFNHMTRRLREFRRYSHDALLRAQQGTQEAFRNLPEAVTLLAENGTIDATTHRAQEWFGLRVGSKIDAERLPWAQQLVERAFNTGKPCELDPAHPIQYFRDGHEYFLHPRVIPIRSGDAGIPGVILFIADVTQTRESNELKRSIVSTVSHQLRTPITSLRMALYLLLDEKAGPLSQKQTELLSTAREDTERLHAIVEDLLDISRLQSGTALATRQPCAPSVLIDQAAESFRATAQDRGIRLTTNYDDMLSHVWADPQHLNYVFTNLISNAIKYTGAGGLIELEAHADPGGVRFSVHDTGKGIPIDYQQRIFEPFYRAPEQGDVSGIGLGLSIARQIVEAHGGTINVDSAVGKGSTFYFVIPVTTPVTPQEDRKS